MVEVQNGILDIKFHNMSGGIYRNICKICIGGNGSVVKWVDTSQNLSEE